jgi:hypothetical protein
LATAARAEWFVRTTTRNRKRDITLDELAVELFVPADAATEAILRGNQ